MIKTADTTPMVILECKSQTFTRAVEYLALLSWTSQEGY
jgi:hypothetical protein